MIQGKEQELTGVPLGTPVQPQAVVLLPTLPGVEVPCGTYGLVCYLI